MTLPEKGQDEKMKANDSEQSQAEEEVAYVTVDEEQTEEEAAHVEVNEEQTEQDEELPMYEINEANWTVRPLDAGNAQVVLLTIDDAPDEYAVEMAETLQQLEVGAIFFVNGHFIENEEGKAKVQKIHEMGFEIGNHTMTHPNMGKLAADEQQLEIIRVNELVEEAIGERPRFFRAPFGLNTEISKQVIEEEDMLAMNWTYGYDWEKDYQDAAALSEIMVHSPYLTEGANLLMHDRKWTAEALREIVDGLKEQGYEFIDPKQIIHHKSQ